MDITVLASTLQTGMLLLVLAAMVYKIHELTALMKIQKRPSGKPCEHLVATVDPVLTELKAMAASRKGDDALRQTNLDIATTLNAQDRLQLARLVALMRLLDEKVTDAATHAETVAEDLAASHARANDTEGPSGAAADAAFKNGV